MQAAYPAPEGNFKTAGPSIPYDFRRYWMKHGMSMDDEGRMVVHDGMRMWYPGIGRRPTNPELLQFALEGDMKNVPNFHMPGERGGRRRYKRTRRVRKTRKVKKSRRHRSRKN